MLKLDSLEAAVLEKLLDGEHIILAELRKQAIGLSVSKREFTGCGFYSTFNLLSSAGPVPVKAKKIIAGDVWADIRELKHGAGFLIYVTNGYLCEMEGYSYDEAWPPLVTEFSVRYQFNDRTDFIKDIDR